MKKIITIVLVSFFAIISLQAQNQCELFTIKNYSFYNPKIYDHPVLLKKGSHQLLQNSYIPIWYKGYCAINLPSYFATKNEYLTYIHSSQIVNFTQLYFDNLYETNKTNLDGIKRFFANDYHLLFRGTINVKNTITGGEFILVAGGDYVSSELDFNKNTAFYEKYNKGLIVFALENGVYKLVDTDLIFKDFSTDEYSKVNDIFSINSLLSANCFENINNLSRSNFNSNTLPTWVINKSE